MRRIAGLSVVVLCAVLALAACGSSSKSSSKTAAASAGAPASSGTTSATTGGTTSSSSGSAQVTAAKQAVAQLTDVTSPVTLPMPTTPVKPGNPKVMIDSCALAAVGCKDLSTYVQQAAKAIGWTNVTLEDGQSVPSTEAGFIQQAVQQHYSAIILVSIVPEDMPAAINAAYAAHIPMTCIECDTKSPALKKEVTDVTEGGIQPGEDLGKWIIAQSDGKAKIISLLDKFYPIVQDRIQGVADEIKQDCPGCTYKQIGFSTSEVGQPGPPTWSSTLSSNPKGSFDYAVSPYDTILGPMWQTAKQEDRTELSIGSFDTSAQGLQAISQGSPTAVDVVPPLEYMSWASVDLIARALAHQPLWTATNLPVKLAVQSNAKAFSQGFWEPNFNYKQKFEALWKAS